MECPGQGVGGLRLISQDENKSFNFDSDKVTNPLNGEKVGMFRSLFRSFSILFVCLLFVCLFRLRRGMGLETLGITSFKQWPRLTRSAGQSVWESICVYTGTYLGEYLHPEESGHSV